MPIVPRPVAANVIFDARDMVYMLYSILWSSFDVEVINRYQRGHGQQNPDRPCLVH